MTTPATQAILPVTPEQVDRQALAAYYQHPFVDNPRLAAEVLSDNWRSGASPAELALLDILARHRKAHSLPGDVGTGKFAIGDRVSKKSGANWNGRVVGFYSTALTPIGYAVESEREIGSVQIYPEAALTPSPCPGDGMRGLLVEVQTDLINLIDPLPCASPLSCDARAILKKIDAALTPSALSGDAGEGWHLIDSAPKDGSEIQARIPGNGEDNVIAWVDDLIDSNGEYCGAWALTRDQEPPDCWTDGYCWEVNEDGDRSVQPTHWKALPSHQGAGE